MKIKISDFAVSISFAFFATAALFLSIGMGNNYLCCIIFSTLHEIGHLIALKMMDCKISEISLGGMGIKISTDSTMLSYKNECIAALCGPAVNAVFILIFCNLKKYGDLFTLAYNINLGLLIINLIPLRILDGGRFLSNLLLNFYGCEKANKISGIVEVAVSFLLIFMLIIMLCLDIVNASVVFFVTCLVFVVIFNVFSGKQNREVL